MSGSSRHTHLYTTAAEAEETEEAHCIAHLAVDRNLNIIRLGRDVLASPTSLGAATRYALREGLDDILSNASSERIVVHEETLAAPELELGRLSQRHDLALAETHVSFTSHMQNHCQTLLSALATQQIDSTWYTPPPSEGPIEPFTVYIDGSHKHHDHIDVDDSEHGSTTFGYVIVDDLGRVIEIKAEKLAEASESLHAEYLALKQSVDTVTQIQPTAEVTFNTDNTHLTHTIGRGNEAPPRFRPLAAYIRETMTTFSEATVEERLRDHNMFADALAAIAHDRPVEYTPIEYSADETAPGYTYTV